MQKDINPLVAISSIALTIILSSVVIAYFISIRTNLGRIAYANATVNSQVLSSTSSFGNAIQFNGLGVQDGDRVKIPVRNTQANIGATDFTIEFWLNATTANNRSTNCSEGQDAWINGNIIVDRDIFDTPSFGDFGISIYGGRVAFGVHNGSQGQSICSTTSVADGQWHHIAVARRSSDGMLYIYIDGVQNRMFDGSNGNISYNNSRTSNWPNDPFLVLGAEKHDYDPSTYPSFNGLMDEFRISNTLRYNANFSRPSQPFTSDPSTIILYRFDESGTPATTTDSAGNLNGQVNYYNGFPKYPPSTIPSQPGPSPTPVPPTSTPIPTTMPTAQPPTPTPIPATPQPTIVSTPNITQPPIATPTAPPTGGTTNALRFDGTNDLMTAVDIPTPNSFTLEAWVRRSRDRNTYETILSDANSFYSQATQTIYVDGGNNDCQGTIDQFAFYQRNPDQVQCSGVTATVNQWFHLAIVRETNGNRRFFINGNQRSILSNTTIPQNSTGIFALGRAGSYNGEFFAGEITEVHFTTTPKYASNFTTSTNTTRDSGTFFLYKMSNGNGQTVSDNSGNNRNAVLGTSTSVQSNDPTWQQVVLQ